MKKKFEIAPKETERLLTWNDAKLYCFSLTIDGKTGWRLPTKEELDEIHESVNESVNDFVKTWYWSSTEYNDINIWVQNFGYGNQFNGGLNKNGGGYVRAIRDR
jgi:hypothetical protein